MAQYDLTPLLAKHLDRHMVVPLLEDLEKKGLFRSRDLQQAKLDLVAGTKMADLAIEEYKALHGDDADVPARLTEHRAAVLAELKRGGEVTLPLTDAIADEKLMGRLAQTESGLSLASLRMEGVNADERSVAELYTYAKTNFDCGRYEAAARYLSAFRRLTSDEEARFSALWGKLAASILTANWEAAREDLTTLRDTIDARTKVDQLLQLQERSWLVHWSLFIFFNVDNGRALLVDFLFEDTRLLNAVQMNCPHVLRYLTAAVLVTGRRKEMYKLVRIVEEEVAAYSDPVTEFLVAIYREFDFDRARECLSRCESVLTNDFFLNFAKDEFMEKARTLVFETTCRIHKNVDIGVLSKRLDLEDEKDAEQKVVQLIRNSRMDARIDSDNNTVVVGTQYPAMYQQVIDSTRELIYRTQQLAATAEKRYSSAI